MNGWHSGEAACHVTTSLQERRLGNPFMSILDLFRSSVLHSYKKPGILTVLSRLTNHKKTYLLSRNFMTMGISILFDTTWFAVGRAFRACEGG
jgi:hypothetical protein